MPNTIKLGLTIDISFDDISDLLCSAFEGGSNDWYEIAEYVKPTTLWTPTRNAGDDTVYRHLQYPLSEGGALVIRDFEDNQTYRLDLKTIKRGLRVMAHDHPRHFSDFRSENGDATTGDVFLQCCLFGQVIYG